MVKSVTVTWKPSRAGVVNQWMVTVSPERITSGWFGLPLVSMALKAAVSWNTPGVPVWVSLKTGEHALYEPGKKPARAPARRVRCSPRHK